MTEPKIHPLLMAMLERLTETNANGRDDESDRWCKLFVDTIHMLYPPKRAGVAAPVSTRGSEHAGRRKERSNEQG